jgi:hypothetical protein
MNHCPACGAERAELLCDACGLTQEAAEVVLRRRLIVHTLVFLPGSLLFPFLSQLYPPLDLDAMLVFFGTLFFLAIFLVVLIYRRTRAHLEVELLKRIFFGLTPLPWVLGAALFLNGRLDRGKPEFHPASVVSRFEMKGLVLGSRRLMVYSWREGHRIERLAAEPDDFARFRDGDAVVVGVMPGALGIPWLYGVYRK